MERISLKPKRKIEFHSGIPLRGNRYGEVFFRVASFECQAQAVSMIVRRSSNFGFQPKSFRIFPESATSIAGSPARLPAGDRNLVALFEGQALAAIDLVEAANLVGIEQRMQHQSALCLPQ